MRFYGLCGSAVALSLALGSHVVAAAAADQPTATNMIFEHKHLANVEQGNEIDYQFNRTVSSAQLLGEPFSDAITLKIVRAKPTGEKDVDMQIYTGERARDLQKIPDVTINPVFIVYFKLAVASLSSLTGAKTTYLQNVFSTGLRDKSKIEPVKVDYKGKTVDAYRITMSPYIDDRNAGKMQGYQGSKFTMIVSDQVPGEIVQVGSVYESTIKAAPRLEERITLNGAEPVK
jgi:hypothetical protein